MRAVAVMLLVLAGALARAAEPSPDELATQAIASVPRQPNWQEIKVDEAKHTSYLLTLVYKTQPGGGDATHYRAAELFSAVERDTTTIARALLKTLVAAGHQPAKERIGISVTGHLPVKGETGADLVRPYGTTRYSSTSDSLTFERWKMP